MASSERIPVRDRHAFRPDLREAELEDRTLLALPPSAYLLNVNTTGFGNYLPTPGFSYYFGSGGGGGGGAGGSGGTNIGFSGISASGPIGATFGMASELGAGLVLADVGRQFAAPSGVSAGPLLSLPDIVSGTTTAAHNNGPIGISASVTPTGGQSASFSSGGNFASTFSGTYNGFATSFEVAGASTASSRVRMGDTASTDTGSSGTTSSGTNNGQSGNSMNQPDTMENAGPNSPGRLTRNQGVFATIRSLGQIGGFRPTGFP